MAGEEHFVSGVAGRYAIALFDLAREANSIDAVKADLDRFDALVAESPDLARLVRSPVFSADEQLSALAPCSRAPALAASPPISSSPDHQQRRLFAVRDMVRAFRNLVARTTAKPRPKSRWPKRSGRSRRRAAQCAQVGDRQGRRPQVKVDPAIIGGLVVKLGSRMVDSSLRTKLNSIKHAMKEAR